MLKRTVMLETVSKSVTERKESTKQVTDQATGVERRRDSHIESSTTEEVRSKRQEETVESYDSGPLPAASQPTSVASQPAPAASQPTLSSRPPVSAVVTSVPDVAETPSRKSPSKHPVAIRVQDEHEADDSASEAPPAPAPLPAGSIPGVSILRTASNEDLERKHAHKLEFQAEPEKEEPEYQRAPLVKPPADLALRAAAASSVKGDDDEEEPAEPPPSRFNMRRKDSIAVAKLRMLRQQEGGSSEEEPEEEQPEPHSPGSPDKKHPVFRPPTVISIVPEQAEEASASEAPESVEPKGASGGGASAKPLINFASAPVAPGEQQTVTESSTHVDKQVTSSEKEEVKTYANEIVTNKSTDEVIKQTKSEVINETSQLPSTAVVPREASAATIVATVVDDVSANVKTPMDDRSKHSL
ncbi:hypothetical protein V5799_019942 [Amblyomma americanum]|uniref:Uncharacterized protein n=1 Tax=Amblyomma americanum TaxID=6943 RepID=A0AAQ4EVN7_AMBAM